MSVLHVACAACRRYVPHSAAMLHSLLTHATEEGVQVHYLHGPDLPPGDRSRLSEMVERCGAMIAFVRVPDDRVSGLATTRSFPASIWYRTLLPELLPDLDRVLYLDSDTIVIESLGPLWASDLRDDYVGAVTNVFKANRAQRLSALGLAPEYAYFNTGVLLMNLAALRRDDSMEAVRGWARQHPDRLLWPEQDAMNVVLGSRRLALHPRWNCMNGLFRFPWSAEVFGEEAVAAARSEPAIRHFEGPRANKPWHYTCDLPMRDLYFRHRRETPWRRTRIEGRTPRNIARRLVRGVRGRLSA
jgi:lipopolysaccharide biosynthesis glycosyltransferase